jgi:hypothetical protein
MFRKLIFLTENIIQESGSQANFIFVLNNNELQTFTGINGSLSINPLNAELNPICKSQLAELFCRVFKFCA